MITAEGYLHQHVCDYLRIRYPGVIYRTDFASGIKLPIWMAARHKRLQSGRAYPDLFIAQPQGAYHGLFIELKASNIYLKNGSLRSNPHLSEQDNMLKRLTKLGFRAEFAVGFDDAKAIIDGYLKR